MRVVRKWTAGKPEENDTTKVEAVSLGFRSGVPEDLFVAMCR